ncbi:hypothetical protein ACWC09_44565 [Streptomyces sp. NPDC001617]
MLPAARPTAVPDPVWAYEFDATAVRLMCQDDPALRSTIAQWVGDVMTHTVTAVGRAGHLQVADQ